MYAYDARRWTFCSFHPLTLFLSLSHTHCVPLSLFIYRSFLYSFYWANFFPVQFVLHSNIFCHLVTKSELNHFIVYKKYGLITSLSLSSHHLIWNLILHAPSFLYVHSKKNPEWLHPDLPVASMKMNVIKI